MQISDRQPSIQRVKLAPLCEQTRMSLPFWHLTNQQKTLQKSARYTFEMAIVLYASVIPLDSEVGAVWP